MLAACSPADDLIRGPSGIGSDTDALLAARLAAADHRAHPGRYDPSAGSLRGYLTRQARHRAVDLVRSEVRRVVRQERSSRLEPWVPDPAPHERVVASEAAAAVRAAMETLPESQRRIVELANFRGLTCREAAKAAGIPEGTVKSRLRLALAKLQTVLAPQLLESS